MFEDTDRLVVRKAVDGDDALLIREGAEYKMVPEHDDFEPLLARGISEKDEDFILKGTVVDKIFIVTDVIYHETFLANTAWKDRFLDLKKNFNYKPSVRRSGAIVVDNGEDVLEAAKAYSESPYFGGVYVESYSSDVFDERVYIDRSVVEEVDL